MTHDGYDLWLGYRPVEDGNRLETYRAAARYIVAAGRTPVLQSARRELSVGLTALLGRNVPVHAAVAGDGAVVAGTPDTEPVIAELGLEDELGKLGPEGFLLRTIRTDGGQAVIVAANRDRGVLYGVFALLRMLQTGGEITSLDVMEHPRIRRRILNHWDNWEPHYAMGSIERGYAGDTLWQWDELPDTVSPRYRDYARANASIGINGAVINNVNAQVDFIRSENLPKVAALAGVFREYGMQLYLTVRFDSPIKLDGLETADPLDPDIVAWWKRKVAEIYASIPDFGGFLVKGDCEGEPGPLAYGRTHAEGANMLADLLAPHGGIVMWRAFVYGGAVGNLHKDRSGQAYVLFTGLDGKFSDNVILQVKNGPADFQVREPFHPLFGAMPNTQTGVELMIAQEYTGHAVQLCWLVPQWRDFLQYDIGAENSPARVKDVLDGSYFGYSDTLVAGIANTGSDRNWTGHDLAQASWYGFGRLAWNPDLESSTIANEWIRMTFGHDPVVVETLRRMLLESWMLYEDYTSPLGLGMMLERDHDPRVKPDPVLRYGPPTDEWVGRDKTVAAGSGQVTQYLPRAARRFGALETCPEELLLWFHRLPLSYRLQSGKTIMQHFEASYGAGPERVRALIDSWNTLAGRIPAQTHARVLERMRMQHTEAEMWRDICLEYWQTKAECAQP